MKTIMIVTGESSGDRYGGDLVQALEKNKYKFVGIGGSHMRKAGVELLLDSARLGVVGIIEILKHYKELKHALTTLQNYITTSPPDLLILIDHPEFNLRLAKTAKKLGIKVLFYISPQIWAWRSWRVHGIGKVIDMMAVIFPFEVNFYQKANIPVRFVGHPLAETVKPSLTIEETLEKFGLQPQNPIIAVCPGSRLAEIQRLLPVFLQTVRVLHQKYPNWQFILPLAPNLTQEDLNLYWQDDLPIKIIENNFYNSIQIANAAITASGTATLEIGLLQTPMIICYKVSPITYAIAKNLITIKCIGLINIVLDNPVLKELIQNQVQVPAIAKEIEKLILDKEYQQEIKTQLKQVPSKMGRGGTAERMAELVEEMIKQVI